MHRPRTLLAALALAVTMPQAGLAATVDVVFDRGKQSKEIRGSIKADDSVDYLLKVREGQVMQVLFAPTKGSCFFNVFEPGNANAAVHIGSSAGNEFGASPTKAGTYRIQAYQMRATARRGEACDFRVSFEVTGEGKAGAAAPAAAAAASPPEVAKGACLFKIGVDAGIVQARAVKPGQWELTLQAKSGNRKVACTVSDGGDIKSFVEVE
jgi:hypothetical protein